MELSPEVLDIIDISHDKDVIEVLKQVIKDDDVIFKSDAPEPTEEPNAEEDIEEIIEIIEEVEETEESLAPYNSNTLSQEKQSKSISDESFDENIQNAEFDKNPTTEIYTFDEESSMFKTQTSKENTNKQSNEYTQKTNNKQVIAYDVDEDWQDEDMEHMEELDDKLDQSSDLMDHQETLERHVLVSGDKKSMNNQISKADIKGNAEPTTKIDKSRTSHDIGNNINIIKSIDNNVGHEIVKNVENNLLYTVLGSKKQSSSLKQEAHYIKMERLDENTIPVEGTIYYDRDNMETLYVAQTVDDNEQYQYDTTAIEQNEQIWEGTNQDSNPNQDQEEEEEEEEEEDEEEEENSQDQIFLHEDEDGQLYFKDDNGALQPVYLTEDGNYAIAENSDDQDSKESQSKSQQSSRQSDDSNFGIQDLEHKSSSNKQNAVVPASSLHDLDNEDNTVTISLIISEDEHGQKRTQVIIPTTDNMKCDICNKSFKTSFQLLRHTRLKHAREEDITTRSFPCDLCPKRYPDQNSLARHRKTHTGDRPFQCLECHKNFPTSTALRRHLTLHNSQSRPLPCIYCGRRFVDKASLIKHEQSHLAGDQRNHTCDICHKSFLHATDLSMHKKYHDPDKKFDCEVCGREFNRLNNLQRHMMVHQQQGANEEILSCDVCGITYKFMSSLTRHMVTTHMNPEKLRQQAEEQRRKRENNYRRYLENRKMYETQHSGGYGTKRSYHHNARILTGTTDDTA